jgi:hypothetical protein
MDEWSSYTPEGRPLVVRREQSGWVAKCGDGPEARSKVLDFALIEAIHRAHDVVGHAAGVGYGKWARETADSIEREYTEKHQGRGLSFGRKGKVTEPGSGFGEPSGSRAR